MAGGARDLEKDFENKMAKTTEQTHSNPAPSPTRPRGAALERFNTRPGVDPMSGAPTPVEPSQLQELGIAVTVEDP